MKLIEAESRTANIPGKVSVTFFLIDPRAEEVYVAGSFNNWNAATTPMISEGRGRWAVQVPLAPGRYEYQFIVDGHWKPDPSRTETVFSALGGLNSVLIVPPPVGVKEEKAPAVAAARATCVA